MADGGQDLAKPARRARRERVPGTPDPVEIAMAAVSRTGATSGVAAELLADQRRLVAAQIAQLGRQRWRDVMVAAFIALVIAGIGAFVWSAARADGVVVQPFAVPPDLERQGFTGAVAAAQLLDKLTAMQDATNSARAASTYADNWGDDIKVEVPYAGISFGELRRLLRETIGRQTRMSGELVRLGDGRLTLTLRTGGKSTRVEGREADLDALLADGARAIYRLTQPYRYAAWVGERPGAHAERLAVLTELSRSPDTNERLWALHGLSLTTDSVAQRQALRARALRLRPDFMPVIGNMPFEARADGQEEEAHLLQARAFAAFEAGQSDYDPRRAARFRLSARSFLEVAVGDMAGAARTLVSTLDLPSDTTNDRLGPFAAAIAWARAHDYPAAHRVLADAGLTDPATLREVEANYGPQERLSRLRAVATDDAGANATELSAILAATTRALEGQTLGARARADLQSEIDQQRTELAQALARSGQLEAAIATIRPVPVNHDAAIRARGLIAALDGRAADSERWFRLAVKRTPSLPAGHAAWAEARLLRGDAAGAIEQAMLAHEKGPRWAEPLKTWGDALMRQGKPGAAAERYEMAAELTPQWGRLHLDWARALRAAGERDAARATLVKALRMTLSAPDLALATRLQGSMRAGGR